MIVVRQFEKHPKTKQQLSFCLLEDTGTSKYFLVYNICLFTRQFLRKDRQIKANDCPEYSEHDNIFYFLSIMHGLSC